MIHSWLTRLTVLFLLPSAAFAQYFGQNKVHYDDFDWKIIKTGNFDVYFYEGERETALDAARMAERAYIKISAALDHEVEEPIPLILYASHSDFQQTNVTPGLISEGTGGITESFKKRVILPFTGSYAELDHVLTHELVHAFQFDILFGDRAGFFANPLAVRIPLWFVEGMAEHLSVGEIDTNTEMWLRDAALEGYLLSIEQLSMVGDIRVYRLGHSVWDYIARTYGRRKVGELLKASGRTASLSRLFENILGASVETVSQGWVEEVRKTYLPQIAEYKKPENYGRRLTDHRKDRSFMNIAPAVSPRGDRFVYISDESLYNDVYMGSTLDGSDLGKLVKGERTAEFESLRFLNTSMAWSPDERYLAFPAKTGPQDALYVLDVEKKKVVRKLKFGFDEVLTPTWSPDGLRIAFVALVGGQSDLFVVDSDGENLERLTEDRFAVRMPSWSSDGRYIAFSTDRGMETDFDELVFGPMVVATYDLATAVIDVIPGQHGQNINPQWSPDGKEIAYISDRTGITNIFITNLEDEETFQITNVLSGVSGITPMSPAMSWSAKGNRMVFCAFTGGGWDVFAINDPHRLKVPYEHPVPPDPGVFDGPPTAGLDAVNTDLVPRRSAPIAAVTSYNFEPAEHEDEPADRVRMVGLQEFIDPQHVSLDEPEGEDVGSVPEFAALPDTSGFEISRYKLKFTQDLAAGGIGFASNVSVFGQTALAFSDILGNHSIYIAANVFGSIAESDLLFAYFNLAKRTNYGLAVFQERQDFYIFTAPDAAEFESQIYRGVQGFLWRPFDRYNRAEFDLAANAVSSRIFPFGFAGESIETGDTRYFASAAAALVHDNTLYGITGPLAGGRNRIRFEQAVGDVRYSSGLVDYRRYINIRQRYALAARVLWAGSYGRNPQIFRIGGPFTLRGPDWGELAGTKVGFANLEFRFPLIEQLVLGWPLPLGFRAIRGVFFFDVGGSWYDDSGFKPFTTDGDGAFRLNDMIAGYGFGVRVNLGLFILRYDLIQQTDMASSVGKSRSYFTFGGISRQSGPGRIGAHGRLNLKNYHRLTLEPLSFATYTSLGLRRVGKRASRLPGPRLGTGTGVTGASFRAPATRRHGHMTSPKILLGALFALALGACAVAPLSASELEEERPYVGSIGFVGNDNISSGKLKSIMRTREPSFFQLFNKPRFRPDFLRYDLAAIEALYHKNGYYEAAANVVESRHDEINNSTHIVIEINEGERTLVGGVRIEGDMPFETSEITKDLSLKRDAPFDSTQVGSDVYSIRNRMWNKGYVLSDIVPSLELSDHRAYLTYKVDIGPPMYVGDIDVAGVQVAGEKSVREQLTFKTGELFSLKKIQDSQQHLFDTSLFRQVKLTPTGIDTVRNTIDLLVEVEERKMSYVELGFGFGTEDNGRLASEWGHRHIPGLGGKLKLESEFAFDVIREGKAQFKKRFSRAGAVYTGPRFPGTRFQSSVDGFYEQDRNPQTVDYDIWGFGLHGRRRVGRFTILYLDFTDEFIKRNIPELEEETTPFTRESDETRSLGITLDRDARNNLLFPTHGSQRSLSLEVAGGPVRGDNHFVRVIGSVSYYRRTWKGMTFAARARTGVAEPYGRSNDDQEPDGIPFENRFYAGGSNSVRGYKENSLGPRLPADDPGAIDPKTAALRGDALGGEVILLTNVELRFPVWRRIKLGGVLFLDGGNVWEEPADIRLKDFNPVRDMDGGGYTSENVNKYRYSLGLGIRYNTPIGPLRLDYGVPVSRTGEIRSFGMFHFNLGHAF